MQTPSFTFSRRGRVMLVAACCGAAWTALSAAATTTPTDSQILGIYIQVNSFDIETALLARAAGQSASLRSVAAHIAADHLGVRRQAYDLARQCKVPVELPEGRSLAAIEHAETMSRLTSLSGRAFDEAVVRSEVDFHRAAIGAVRTTLLPAATCAALKTHFTEVLPAFEYHLAEMEKVQREFANHER